MPAASPILREPSLPRLPAADHALFNLYASVHLDIHALAEQSGRDLAELTAWAAAPEIRLYTEAYREVAGHALLHAATAALVESIRLTNDPVEKRRAATALLRALTTGGVPRVRAARPHPCEPPAPEENARLGDAAFSSHPPPPGGGAAGGGVRGGGGSVSTSPTKPPRATSPASATSAGTQRLPSRPSAEAAHPPAMHTPTSAPPLPTPDLFLPTPLSPLSTFHSPLPAQTSRLLAAAGRAPPRAPSG